MMILKNFRFRTAFHWVGGSQNLITQKYRKIKGKKNYSEENLLTSKGSKVEETFPILSC
jgi:hypothetical protein